MRESRIRKTWSTLLLLLLALLAWHFARPALLLGDPPDTLSYALLMIAQEAVLFGVPALFLRPWRLRDTDDPARGWRGCLTALLAGIVLALLLNPVSAGWSSLLYLAPQEAPMPATAWEWLVMALATVVVPALAEEAFFRGGVLCGLARGMSARAAFAATAVIFTLMHGRMAALPAHLACGALFTLGMLRYGRLWPPIIMHAGYNAATLALVGLGVTLPWLTLAATVPVMAIIVAAMARQTVWHGHAPLPMADRVWGAAAMAALVGYFLVRLR